MAFDTSTVLFNAHKDELGLWPYHVSVAGRTIAQHEDGMVRQNYHEHVLILTLSGRGCVEVGQAQFDALPGDLIWIDTAHSYAHKASPAEDWCYLWLSCKGHGIDALYTHLGFDRSPKVAKCIGTKGSFEGVIDALSDVASAPLARVSAHVSEVLGTLASLRGQHSRISQPSAVTRVSQHVRAELDRTWCVGDMAEIAGISQSQLFRRFQEETGNSPMGWMRQERMVLARYLLRSTELPITQVALRCGYSDPFHFSRDFKRSHGDAPRYFRTQFRGEGN